MFKQIRRKKTEGTAIPQSLKRTDHRAQMTLKSGDAQVPDMKWHNICIQPMQSPIYLKSSLDYF